MVSLSSFSPILLSCTLPWIREYFLVIFLLQFEDSNSHMQAQQLIALLAGFLVMLVNGSLYVYGTMTPYIYTFLHFKGASVAISDLSIIITIAVIATNSGILLSNFKVFTFSNRVTSLIASLGISLSMVLLSLVDHFAFYIIIYGLLYGVFIGFGYMAPLKNCYDHLPNNKGLCSGVCLMGFGLGAFFFNFVLVAVVNPDNEKQDSNRLFPEAIGNNLPLALQILGGIYAVIGIVGVILTIPPRQPLGTASSSSTALIVKKESDQLQGHSHVSKFALSLAVQKKITWLALILGTTAPFGLFLAFNYKQYGGLYIKDDKYLSLLGSLGSVGNGVFRMFWGILLDILPFRKIKLIMVGIFIISCISIKWAVQEQASYLITVVVVYGAYGGLYSIYPTQTVRMVGRQLGPKLYYITFLGFSSGAILQYFAHKFLVEVFHDDGYTYCFAIFGFFLLVALGLILKVDLEQGVQKVSPSQVQTTLSKEEE